MKARLLIPDDYTDSLVAELDDTTRLFVQGLYLIADDFGVAVDDPAEINKELFPGQPPRRVAEMIDVLWAIGLVKRMVAPDGTRVIVLYDFANHRKEAPKGKPRLGDPMKFMPLPTPSVADRNHIQAKYDVFPDGSMRRVECESCKDVNGTLRYVAPVLGLDDYWGGAVVADRLEIVPSDDEGGNPSLLCRTCRTDLEYVEPDIRPPADVVDIKDRRILQVFEAWVEETGRTAATKLDARRRGVIERALAAYPLEDVMDAIKGWRHFPHNRGENEAGRVYNDVELLLRDSAHIERFRDAERQGPRRPGNVRRAAANVGNHGTESSVGWDS